MKVSRADFELYNNGGHLSFFRVVIMIEMIMEMPSLMIYDLCAGMLIFQLCSGESDVEIQDSVRGK